MAQPDLVDIPIDRLLATAERAVRQKPQDAQAHYVLGRIQTLAYATGASSVQGIRDSQATDRGVFAHQNCTPNRVKKPVTPAAQKHLSMAIQEYGRAVALDPHLPAARLGYAWALEQSGRKSDAVSQYRLVIRMAWPQEKGQERAVWSKSLTQEAGGYLIKLLDPQKDSAEIAHLNDLLAQAAKLPRFMTPLLIPMEENLDFEELVDRRSSVRFDLDGSGRREVWGWPTPRAAWLVYLKHRTRVDSALQMFGSVTFLTCWDDGYEALAALDTDGDGWVSGPELDGIALWQDVDRDGVSSPDEIETLAQRGIVGLRCSFERRYRGYLESCSGVRYRDGHSTSSYDWIMP